MKTGRKTQSYSGLTCPLTIGRDPTREEEASRLAEEGFELLFSHEMEALQKLLKEQDLPALGAAAMLASWLLIWGRRKDVRRVYVASPPA